MDQLYMQTLISINLGIWILVAIHVFKFIWRIIWFVLNYFQMQVENEIYKDSL